MQRCSSESGRASKPVCKIAVLALLAPSRMSAAFSTHNTFAPSSANRRVTAQPTTPAPMTMTSNASDGGAAGASDGDAAADGATNAGAAGGGE